MWEMCVACAERDVGGVRGMGSGHPLTDQSQGVQVLERGRQSEVHPRISDNLNSSRFQVPPEVMSRVAALTIPRRA